MIPKFDVYHKDLHSSYISFEKYKLFFQNQPFNGYIKLDDTQIQCFFFIKEGKDISSFMFSDGNMAVVDLSEIPILFKQPFFISSYVLPQQVVDFFARCYTAQLVLDSFAFDSVNLDKFLSQIESKKITGFIEASRAGEPKKYIYLYGGKIFGYMNIRGDNGVFEKNLDKNQIQSAFRKSSVKLYSLVIGASAVKREAVYTQSDSGQKNKPIVEKDNDNRLSVFECYEDIFKMLERETAPDDFTSIWRTSALELSTKYLFLNPFAGEFNYENGEIDIWEKIDTNTAAQAMDELINAIAKKANLPKDGIKAIKDKYSDILVTYEIRS